MVPALTRAGPDLARKLRRYIDRYNRIAKPFRWASADPTRRIA